MTTFSKGATRMKVSSAVRRVAGSAIALAAATLLAFATSASADTYTPANTTEFQAAITSANASIGVPDLIQLAPGVAYSPDATVEILDDLTIRGNPQLQQGPAEAPTILQGTAVPPTNDFVRVGEGVSLALKGFQMQSGGDPEAPNIRVLGNVVVENLSISGSGGDAIVTDPAAVGTPTVTIVNSTLHANQRSAVVITSNATMSMNYTTVTNNAGGGLGLDGPVTIRNSIVALNSIANCSGGTPGLPQYTIEFVTDTDVDQLFSPGVGDCRFYDPEGAGNLTPANSASAVGLGAVFAQNGGPTRSRALTATSTSRDSSDNTGCRTVDQRYFIRSDATCDRGAFEFGAVRDTAGPTCGVSAVRAGPPKQQDVTVQDTGSGLELINNIVITNGTVATPTFSLGARTPIVVTATKTDQSQLTRWSFNARDVAGNVTDCR
jgi:Right handed beta helix region